MIDLKPFCANESDKRAWLRAPFREGEFDYAADGHVIVEVPASGKHPHPLNKPIGASVDRVLDDAGAGPYMPLAGLTRTLVEQWPCERCRGKGNIADCPECEGEGEVTLENEYNEYEVECASCGGDGRCGQTTGVPCCGCNGTGTGCVIMRLGEFKACHQRRYLKLVEVLPNVVVAVRPGDDSSPLFFKFDGGRGALMPIRPSMVL
jgi:hypothetical protein